MLYVSSPALTFAMAVDISKLRELLGCAFPDDVVDVARLADDDDHYAIRVVSSRFCGKSKIEQHRMVYDALSGVVVHALQIQTSVEERDGQ